MDRVFHIVIVTIILSSFGSGQINFSIFQLPSSSGDSVTLSLRSNGFRSVKAIGFEFIPNPGMDFKFSEARVIRGADLMNFPEKVRINISEKYIKVFIVKRRFSAMMYSRGGELLQITLPTTPPFSAKLRNWSVMVLDSANEMLPASFSDSILKSETSSPIRYSIRAYPNPVKNNLTFETESGEWFSIVVYDILGRTMLSREFSPSSAQNQKFQLPMSEFAPGVYFVRLIRQQQPEQIFKVMKIR